MIPLLVGVVIVAALLLAISLCRETARNERDIERAESIMDYVQAAKARRENRKEAK